MRGQERFLWYQVSLQESNLYGCLEDQQYANRKRKNQVLAVNLVGFFSPCLLVIAISNGGS